MVQRWTRRKPTAGLIGQSPSLWMVTRSARFQAFHEQILGKLKAFLRAPLRVISPMGWLNLEYLLPSFFFVARFLSDLARTSKLADSGNAAAFAKPSQESTSSYRNLLQHIWILHQQASAQVFPAFREGHNVGFMSPQSQSSGNLLQRIGVLHQQASTQAFPLATTAPVGVRSVSRMSIQNQMSPLASRRNMQNAAPLPPIWSSPLVHHEGKQRDEAQSSLQKPASSSQVLKSSRLISASLAGNVLEKTERITTLQKNNLYASPAAVQIGVMHPLKLSHTRLALAPMAIKTPGEKNPIPAEASIFPKLELGGVHQAVSTRSLTGTQQEDGHWQHDSDEQELQYAQPMASATAMMARAQQNKNKFASSQTEQFTAPSKPPVSPGLSNLELNRMADQVYRLIARKMQIENERQGKWY